MGITLCTISDFSLDEAPTKVTADMMTLTSDHKLTFTALGDWGMESEAQRAVAQQLGEWSVNHDSAFNAAIGQ